VNNILTNLDDANLSILLVVSLAGEISNIQMFWRSIIFHILLFKTSVVMLIFRIEVRQK